MRSGRLFGVVVGMAGFPFVSCDLSGDEVGVCGGVFDLAPDVLWDMGVAVDELEPSFDVFKVIDSFGVRDLVHLCFSRVEDFLGQDLGGGVDLHVSRKVGVMNEVRGADRALVGGGSKLETRR